MVFERDITSIDELPKVANELLQTFTTERIFLFNAEMGSGKTTFIKELSKQLGSNANFSSPTYSIVNEYKIPDGKIFHFDLYRLKNEDELIEIGFTDYLQPNAYLFIEWPQLASNLLEGEKYLTIQIQQNGDNRILTAKDTSNQWFTNSLKLITVVK